MNKNRRWGLAAGIVVAIVLWIGGSLVRTAYPELMHSFGKVALGVILGALFAFVSRVESERYPQKKPWEINNRVGNYNLAYGCASGVIMGVLGDGFIAGDFEPRFENFIIMGLFLGFVMFIGSSFDDFVKPTEVKFERRIDVINAIIVIFLLIILILYYLSGGMFAVASDPTFGISVVVFRVIFSILVAGVLERKLEKGAIQVLHDRVLGFSLVVVPFLSYFYLR